MPATYVVATNGDDLARLRAHLEALASKLQPGDEVIVGCDGSSLFWPKLEGPGREHHPVSELVEEFRAGDPDRAWLFFGMDFANGLEPVLVLAAKLAKHPIVDLPDAASVTLPPCQPTGAERATTA